MKTEWTDGDNKKTLITTEVLSHLLTGGLNRNVNIMYMKNDEKAKLTYNLFTCTHNSVVSMF